MSQQRAFLHAPCPVPSCPACEPNSGSVLSSVSTTAYSSRGGRHGYAIKWIDLMGCRAHAMSPESFRLALYRRFPWQHPRHKRGASQTPTGLAAGWALVSSHCCRCRMRPCDLRPPGARQDHVRRSRSAYRNPWNDACQSCRHIRLGPKNTGAVDFA
jgi:hypothetical protein